MATAIVYVPSGEEELRQQFLRDIRLAAIDTGITTEPPTTPGSDWYLLGTACSNLALLSIGNVQLAADDMNVLTSTGPALETLRIADGLPEVGASRASGKIVPEVLGPTTLVSGTQFVYPNGLRGRVVGNYVNIQNGAEVNVESVDAGSLTNLKAGAKVRFVGQPVNIATDAVVSTGSPITGGTDVETDERKRQRILNTRRNRPSGGNWAYIRQIVLDELGSVQDCYVYPALGGPSSVKAIPVRAFDRENKDFSRACSSALLNRTRQLIWSKVPIGDKHVIQAATDQEVDFTIRVTIPDSALSGGNGLGWTDSTVWPTLETADGNTVQIDDVTANANVLTVDAETATSPVAGQTTIAWYCVPDRKFYTALVVGVSGAAGAWVLTLDRPLRSEDGEAPQVGDYICPAAQNLDGYAEKWLDIFEELGPGEQTADAGRLPRAKRHPYVTDEDPASITTVNLGRLPQAFPEITAISFGSAATTTPTVPSDVDDPPSILIPRKFAIYPT